MLDQMEKGQLGGWTKKSAPEEAIKYYYLSERATMKEVIMSIRADEAIHRELNHRFADLDVDTDIDSETVEIKEINKDVK